MALGFGGVRRRPVRLRGLGLPPLRPGTYPKGRALAAACRSLHDAYKRSRGESTTGSWAIHDRAWAMGCSWTRHERAKRSG